VPSALATGPVVGDVFTVPPGLNTGVGSAVPAVAPLPPAPPLVAVAADAALFIVVKLPATTKIAGPAAAPPPPGPPLGTPVEVPPVAPDPPERLANAPPDPAEGKRTIQV
jgi:hypothetical protein